MKKTIFMTFGAAAVAGCCLMPGANKPYVSAECGENEIRLYPSPVAYEVVRNGKTLVAKTPIGLCVDGACVAKDAKLVKSETRKLSGAVASPVYKKSSVDLSGRETFADFGDWGVRLVARKDGVAYRIELKKGGTIENECAGVTIPSKDATCWFNRTGSVGCEETIPESAKAGQIATNEKAPLIYLPFVYSVDGQTVAVSESDIHEYPIWNFKKIEQTDAGVKLVGTFDGYPKKTERVGGWGNARNLKSGGRWVRVTEREKFLVKTAGARTLPWREFMLADSPAKLCEADLTFALATPAAKGSDFSWVKPGKVAWDWWNCFDNQGDKGCNTKTYERFIDFAQKTGVEYVIFDEGWSESLNIWKFHKDVDVPHLIKYANARGVGIILWMAWAQVYGEEAKVAEHFAKLGAKGFKVDFMDRGDAEIAVFLEKFAAECAKRKMLVDYHGAYRPVGLNRTYPNVLNFEGIHGLEMMKFRNYGAEMMANDVRAFFLRLSAGSMDYTPGAMLNHKIGTYKSGTQFPGSVGTRCRQMAMMSMYEAPLQMLCDSPTNYEKNMECFTYMAAVPVVWKNTVGLPGCPDKMAAVARQAKDGSWYAAGMTNAEARDYELPTCFLGSGTWKAEIFRDAPDAAEHPMKYVHETKTVKAGDKMAFHMAPGGGFTVHFTK